jgi:hypothetical protein
MTCALRTNIIYSQVLADSDLAYIGIPSATSAFCRFMQLGSTMAQTQIVCPTTPFLRTRLR